MPVVAKTFVRTLKGKIYNKITANGNTSYHGYLIRLLHDK